MRRTWIWQPALLIIAILGLLPASQAATSAVQPRETPADVQRSHYSLRFYGHGVNDIDRVKIQIDDPTNSNPGPPADVGATDFTLEFWMKASAADNPAGAVSCGSNVNWIYGNIVFDRDRFNQGRKFGLSIAGGKLVFGVTGDGTGDRTICGTTNVLDGQWHHVAVQRRRSDGWLWLYVDGRLQAQADGPDGDVSYPDDGIPGNFCGGPCTNSDPYLVIGAEKHDAGREYPSYSGWIDEVRLSNVVRYAADFVRPSTPFAPDPNTVALYHFDEGTGDIIHDTAGASGGPSHGVRKYGGSPAGPEWSTDTPFSLIPRAVTATPTRAATSAIKHMPTPTRTPTRTPIRTRTSTCKLTLGGNQSASHTPARASVTARSHTRSWMPVPISTPGPLTALTSGNDALTFEGIDSDR